MEIGFTYDLKSDYRSDTEMPDDALAEFDVEETIARICEAVASGGHHVVRIGNIRNLLDRLPDLGVDIVFNICEGEGGRNRESEVPVILDLYRIPYVGSDGVALGMTLDKVAAKKSFIADGVATPKYFIAEEISGAWDLDSMRFPFIVKPRHEGSSKGISDESVVCDKKALRNQVEKVVRTYRQPALVEEFISGKEFTVLVVGNKPAVALTPVQIGILGKLDLGGLIYTSRRVNNTDIEYICPPKIPKAVDRVLREAALKAYRSVDCRDFGRVDIRLDSWNRPYVLEVNPLPSLSTEDIFPCVAEAEGTTYDALIVEIIDIALRRHGFKRERRRH